MTKNLLSLAGALLFSILLLSAQPGCQVVDVDPFSRAPIAKGLPRSAYDLSLQGGTVAWRVDCENPSDKRAAFRAVLTGRTAAGVALEVNASWTVEPQSAISARGKQAVEGLKPGDAVDPATVNCVLTPGARCVTCTCAENCGGRRCAGAPANWPQEEIRARYDVDVPTKVASAEIVENVRPVLEVVYDQVEARTYGCTLWLQNDGPTEMVCDVEVLVDGEVRATKTVGAPAFSKGKPVTFPIVFKERAPHEFRARIARSERIQIGKPEARREVLLRVTAYCPCHDCCGRRARGVTASGALAEPGVCAAARGQFAFGTELLVPGYGPATVLDRGGEIDRGDLDVFFWSHRDAKEWGSRWLRVEVL